MIKIVHSIVREYDKDKKFAATLVRAVLLENNKLMGISAEQRIRHHTDYLDKMAIDIAKNENYATLFRNWVTVNVKEEVEEL